MSLFRRMAAIGEASQHLSRLNRFGCMIALVAIAQTANAEQELTEISDPDTFRVSKEQVSKQAEEPFQFSGRVVDETRPQWEKYETAIREFPDATSCLAASEANAEEPNLLAVDWEKVRGLYATEVCFFRIFATLKDVELVKKWMHQNNLSNVKLSKTIAVKGFYDFTIFGLWTYEELRSNTSIIDGFFNSIAQDIVQADAVLSVLFMEPDKVVGVEISAKVK